MTADLKARLAAARSRYCQAQGHMLLVRLARRHPDGATRYCLSCKATRPDVKDRP